MSILFRYAMEAWSSHAIFVSGCVSMLHRAQLTCHNFSKNMHYYPSCIFRNQDLNFLKVSTFLGGTFLIISDVN